MVEVILLAFILLFEEFDLRYIPAFPHLIESRFLMVNSSPLPFADMILFEKIFSLQIGQIISLDIVSASLLTSILPLIRYGLK